MAVVEIQRRHVGRTTAQLDANDAGAAIVSPGLGIIREIDVAAAGADIDLTRDPLDATILLGPANALEALAGGVLKVKGPDGVTVTLGALVALPVGWSADGLCLTAIVDSGTTVTAVRVRW